MVLLLEVANDAEVGDGAQHRQTLDVAFRRQEHTRGRGVQLHVVVEINHHFRQHCTWMAASVVTEVQTVAAPGCDREIYGGSVSLQIMIV